MNQATEQLNRFAAQNPWPDTTDIKGFRFSLDGGGRELVKNKLREIDAKVMIEIGCMLGGSVLDWCETKDDLTVIGIDPWQGEWVTTIERYTTKAHMQSCFKDIADRDEFISSLRTHGNFKSAMANLSHFKDRFIPVVGYSPEKLYTIADAGITPDLIYIDAMKHGDDLLVANTLFPDSVLCGDDWTWGADQGYPMRTNVLEFVANHNYSVHAERATWIISKEPG